jgi:hypothetical protein
MVWLVESEMHRYRPDGRRAIGRGYEDGDPFALLFTSGGVPVSRNCVSNRHGSP